MNQLDFDETELIRELERLSPRARAVFAAACAERLLPAYAPFAAKSGRGDPGELASLLHRLWRDLEGEPMTPRQVEEALDRCDGLIPDDDEGEWVEGQGAASDAAEASTYAFACRKDGRPQDAAWAGRCAYEALDSFLRSGEDTDVGTSGGAVRLPPHSSELARVEQALAHPLVQAELARQRRDLEHLMAASNEVDWADVVAGVRERAEAEAQQFFG